MKVHRGSGSWPGGPGPVVTIGNFDGVHRGHRALVHATKAEAERRGVPACVYTFDPAPVQVLRPDRAPPRIQRLADKLDLLRELAVDHVVIETFTREFAKQEASAFARDVIRGRLGAGALVLGWDFRFGRGRDGTVEGMRAWLDVPVAQVQPVLHDGEPVSSTRIRRAVVDGELEVAAALLGRPHTLCGPVVHGDARGRQLGFPTANVQVQTALLPPTGVYAVRLLADGVWVPGVANLGRRPTFGPGGVGLEVHLLDWSGDLYGVEVCVAVHARIRDERAFSTVDALVAQIRDDVAAARRLLG